jgi:hypothetical protein
MAAGLQQQLVKSKRPGFGDAPTMHLLAAHAIAECDLALKDEDTHSVLGQPFRNRSTGEPTTDRDHIVSFGHASFRNDDAAPIGTNKGNELSRNNDPTSSLAGRGQIVTTPIRPKVRNGKAT